jgi:hypothetical protein
VRWCSAAGRKSGVAKLLKDEFPSVMVWHCASHRLELSVADTVKAVAGTNRFRAFMDKLCHLSCVTEEQQGITRMC